MTKQDNTLIHLTKNPNFSDIELKYFHLTTSKNFIRIH